MHVLGTMPHAGPGAVRRPDGRAAGALAGRTVTEDGFEAHLGTNHLGPFLLSLLLLPSMLQTARQVRSPNGALPEPGPPPASQHWSDRERRCAVARGRQRIQQSSPGVVHVLTACHARRPRLCLTCRRECMRSL
jgi:NAD(P)-dependent dehydrogenase (short-subunit alcohol dehydrogenase family)